MNKNNIIGLAIIGIILVAFSYFNKPSEEQIAKENRYRDSIAAVNEQNVAEAKRAEEAAKATQQAVSVADTLSKDQRLVDAYGVFASAAEREAKYYTLENEKMVITLNALGGKVESVKLKDYTTYTGDELVLFRGEDNIFGFDFFASNRKIATNNLFFEMVGESNNVTVTGDNKKSVTMRLNAGNGRYIDYIYTMTGNSFMLDFDMRFVNMDKILSGNTSFLNLTWQINSPQHEKGHKNENQYTTIAYKHLDGDTDDLNAGADADEEKLDTRVEWVSFKDQFFSSIIVSDNGFQSPIMNTESYQEGSGLIKKFKANLGVHYTGTNDEKVKLNLYFGPNKYNILEDQGKGFEKLVPLGWGIFGWVNRYVVIPVFNYLEGSIASMGLIILILTILIKLVLFPLTYKSYQSSAKMRVLKPEVEEISKKFPKKEDAMKKQQATMALYKKAGASPFGGCIPLLVQMPIIIAMFRFFPSAFELRQKSFLWADDLSSYDAILSWNLDIPLISHYYGNHISLFTLLMAVALVLSTKLNSSQMGDANAQMPGMKFMMNWGMPVMMVFWFNNYAAGLSYYYFLSNVITIGQSMAFRKFVDENAIKRKIQANKSKPVKKSKLAMRMEEMAKQKGYNQKKK
ncbi:MAG: membrane protein insertase YidC [Bacteroidales bacterium]|jgi:YidC/Oxa1 family membrane protein insertase|nr:membrane protein insertase YidC [Bacteroidales bacterium]